LANFNASIYDHKISKFRMLISYNAYIFPYTINGFNQFSILIKVAGLQQMTSTTSFSKSTEIVVVYNRESKYYNGTLIGTSSTFQ